MILRISKDMSAGLEPFCEKAGQMIVDEAKSNAPVRTGRLRHEGISYALDRVGSAVTKIYVGFTKYGWYGIFSELGTVKQGARPFMVPAYERVRERIITMAREEWVAATILQNRR